MSLTHKRIYEFGEFRLKITARILERDGNPVPLGSKAFEVLTCLVMDAGHVVTKDTLLKTVWPEAYVAEANLSQHIFALRKAFGDRAALIVTVPGRGYQFTGQVRELQEPPPSAPNDYGSFLLQRTRERTRIVIEDTTEIVTSARDLQAQSIPIDSSPAHMLPAQRSATEKRSAIENRSVLRNGHSSAWMAAAAVGLILLAGWFAARRYASTPYVASTPHANRRVVIAEFENRTRDSEFDVVLRQALEIDLDQSPYLDVMSEPELERTRQTAFVPVDAREACQRSNRPVLITGSVASVGQLYLLTVEATDCESGRLLAGAKAAVENKEQMLDAIDAASVRLRKALGEPEASVERFQSPAAQR